MKRGALLSGLLGATMAFTACAPDAVTPLRPAEAPSRNEGTDSLTLTVISDLSAVGSWDRTETYSWKLTKTPDAATLPITLGETKNILYSLKVDRSVSIVDDFNSKGEVCLTTYYGVPANLSIQGKIQYYDPDANGGHGDWFDIPTATNEVDMSKPRDAGEEEWGGKITCYRYKASMGSEPHQTVEWLGYQYVSLVFISNLTSGEDHLKARKQFFLPTQPNIKQKYAAASLSDLQSCPAGFTCGSLPAELQSPITLTGSREFNYSIAVTNASAGYGAHRLRNRANLVADDGVGALVNADTWLEYSGGGIDASVWSCNAGYWQDAGSFPYWKNHAAADLVSSVFTGAEAYQTANGNLMSTRTLVRALRFDGENPNPTASAAENLLREGTARLLNLEHQGGDVAGLKAQVDAALASGNRITMLELWQALRGQNFAGTCRLL